MSYHIYHSICHIIYHIYHILYLLIYKKNSPSSILKMEAVCLFKTSVKNCDPHVVLPQENVPFINGDFKISSNRRILLPKPSALTSPCDIRSTHTCVTLDTHGRSHATNHHLVQKHTSSCFDN